MENNHNTVFTLISYVKSLLPVPFERKTNLNIYLDLFKYILFILYVFKYIWVLMNKNNWHRAGSQQVFRK